ncbi:MAG: phosphate signaling complex protein PhoU [Paracoccaceae bacterium]
MGPHIVSSFDDDLVAVQGKISEMGGLAEELLRKALEAVQNRDADLAEQVRERDKELDALELELETMATRVIALRQPMAQDLRVLISALKIASTLERIGDLAKNIARRAAYLAQARPVKISHSIVNMGQATLAQLSEVLDAHGSRNAEQAVAIWKSDVKIDEMYNAIFREVVTYMMEDSRMIGLGSQLLFVAKNLERIGDHTTHISEMIYYIVKGEPLGDDRPKGEPIGLDFE